MQKADIIVVGSGIGGLEVALTMAKEGMRVIVLERQHQAGGCMQSFSRGKVMFDNALHCVGGLDEKGQLYDAFSNLGLIHLPWKRLDMCCYDEVHISGKVFSIPQGMMQYTNALKTYFPHQEEGLDAWHEILTSTDEEWLKQTSAWETLNSLFTDSLLIQVLSAPAMFKMELRKDTLPLFSLVHGTTPYIESAWRLQGDGNSLVKYLIHQIRSYGSEVITDKEVTRFNVKDGHIVSATCSDGSIYEGNIFVSNAHPSVTCNMLEEKALKPVFRKRLATLPNTHGIFTLHLQMRHEALRYFNHNKYVIKSTDCWDAAVDNDLKVSGIMLSARVPANGEHVVNLDILTPMKWETVEKFAKSSMRRRPKAYKDIKNIITEQCLDIAEEAIPGLRKMVLKSWSSTPLTYYNYNHAPQGSAFGFRKDYAHPLNTVLSPKTPIPNLFMTGHNLMLHGMHGVTVTAAHTAIEINKKITQIKDL